MSRAKTPLELFQRPGWPPSVRSTSMPLRMFWAQRNDPSFEFTEPEIGILRRAVVGEDVGIRFLTPHKAASLLKLRGLVDARE